MGGGGGGGSSINQRHCTLAQSLAKPCAVRQVWWWQWPGLSGGLFVTSSQAWHRQSNPTVPDALIGMTRPTVPARHSGHCLLFA